MKTILKIISAPFKGVAWLIREVLAFILRDFYGCMVVYPRMPRYEFNVIRKKKHGK